MPRFSVVVAAGGEVLVLVRRIGWRRRLIIIPHGKEQGQTIAHDLLAALARNIPESYIRTTERFMSSAQFSESETNARR